MRARAGPTLCGHEAHHDFRWSDGRAAGHAEDACGGGVRREAGDGSAHARTQRRCQPECRLVSVDEVTQQAQDLDCEVARLPARGEWVAEGTARALQWACADQRTFVLPAPESARMRIHIIAGVMCTSFFDWRYRARAAWSGQTTGRA